MVRWKLLRLTVLMLVNTAVFAGNAFAGSIAIFNTGQGSDGLALPVGVLDGNKPAKT